MVDGQRDVGDVDRNRAHGCGGGLADHRSYDDLLGILPMIALYRLCRNGPSMGHGDVLAGLLLGLNCAVMLIPSRALPGPEGLFRDGAMTIVWTATLVFLVIEAHRSTPPLARGPDRG